ncbi:FecR family protein [Altericroceibacterium endophyticum]|uniref:FecR family protein n=1 Tax=Altericroceibacterium endophyticum TaxID=1808508 RepID=A0A6I4T261_9SPHN|nr:FecR domain-containing protein [Altericroceibacterium endophyticum]MXO64311.1 FecR family protein [Altericroceibacterium endophyticum]
MNAHITEQDEEDAALWVARHMGGPVDATAFSQWLDGKAGRRELFDAMWASCMDESVTASLQEHATIQDNAPVAANDTAVVARPARALMALAAVAAVLVVIGGFAWQPMSHMLAPGESYQTAIGEVREIALADGSTVVLNGASAIEVQLADDGRHVTLNTGEALFDVAHDEKRPFTVEAGAGEVTVLGTRFDLALNDQQIELEVLRGVVRFEAAGADNTAVLVRRAQRSVLQGGAPTAPVSAVVRSEPDWRTGWLEMTDMPLGQLIPRLERWTAKTIELEDPALLERRVAGRFKLSDPGEVLTGLGAIHGFQVRETDTSFVIQGP